ncbi:MAG: TerC family protein [Proteobacteria bacterium]|nr:TerC family protein [Pseudomonadota bacterium]
MDLLADPQVWLSFITLAVLEIVLGIDNIIFLSILVGKLPAAQQRSARLLGLGFAMLTRLALLFSISWITTMREPLFHVFAQGISGRDLILFAGGAFLLVKSSSEIKQTIRPSHKARTAKLRDKLWLIILQIGLIDIVFSLDSVFTAIGLAQYIQVMVAAIICSVLVMMMVSGSVNEFIDRQPTIKILALAFLVLVGAVLVAESVEIEVDKTYLYVAMAFSFAVELLNIQMRKYRGA